MAWQREQWLACCGDAAKYLGRATYEDLVTRWASVVNSLRADVPLSGDDFDDYLRCIDIEGPVEAYVFQCRHCHQLLGYSDSE